MPLSPANWWDLLQTTAPYKNEWPEAVTADWDMWEDRVETHKKLGPAWDDFIPHIPVFKRLLEPKGLDNRVDNPRKVSGILSNNYLFPITRWKKDRDGVRTLITEHTENPRSIQVEEFLEDLITRGGLPYDADSVDELAGFVMNTFLAYPERRDWKPFMDLDGNEYDKMKFGVNNFIGPAQLTTRALMVRDKILSNSFFKNAEARFA